MNTKLLVSDTCHYRIDYEINPYMSIGLQPDPRRAATEHDSIIAAHRAAGRAVEYLPSAPECPDMVFTANTAVVAGDRAVLGHPPGPRLPEIPYVRTWLRQCGYDVLDAPYPFSGQGDALRCGTVMLAASGQRTDRRMHPVLADHLGLEVVALHIFWPALVRPGPGRRGRRQPTHPGVLPRSCSIALACTRCMSSGST